VPESRLTYFTNPTPLLTFIFISLLIAHNIIAWSQRDQSAANRPTHHNDHRRGDGRRRRMRSFILSHDSLASATRHDTICYDMESLT